LERITPQPTTLSKWQEAARQQYELWQEVQVSLDLNPQSEPQKKWELQNKKCVMIDPLEPLDWAYISLNAHELSPLFYYFP
jgi:hypothetical protein